MASSRVYVQEGIYDEFVNKLVVKVKDWVVGDPFDPRVRQGPQVRIEEIMDGFLCRDSKLISLRLGYLD